MSNQRPGKTHRAGASDNNHDMQMKNMFRECKDLLNKAGEEESAFYFEQLEEWIMCGKPLPSDSKEIGRMLGL